MIIIQIGLLLLSFIQFIFIDAFWAGSFYFFFIWVILLQILWFYIERATVQKLTFAFLTLFSILNIQFLPQFPFLMLGVFALEMRKICSLKYTLLLLTLTLGISLGLLGTQGIWLTLTEWGFLIAIIGLCLSLSKQEENRQKQEEEWYKLSQMQEELKKQSQLLKTQMGSLEELSRINERNRISRDLHDSVGHTLSTIVIQLAAISKITQPKLPKVAQMVEELHQFTKDGLTNVREVIHEMKPKDYRRVAFIDRLQVLIQNFEKNTKIQIIFNTNESLWLLNEEQEMLIYRAIQEFLGNSSKHSSATEVRIQYHYTPSSIILTLHDNGKGTDSIVPKMGLSGMKERVKLLGGKITIQSASGEGFRIRIVLPKGGFLNDRERH